eukprot:352530-Chlamydomonas_euryale.AAC.1
MVGWEVCSSLMVGWEVCSSLMVGWEKHKQKTRSTGARTVAQAPGSTQKGRLGRLQHALLAKLRGRPPLRLRGSGRVLLEAVGQVLLIPKHNPPATAPGNAARKVQALGRQPAPSASACTASTEDTPLQTGLRQCGACGQGGLDFRKKREEGHTCLTVAPQLPPAAGKNTCDNAAHAHRRARCTVASQPPRGCLAVTLPPVPVQQQYTAPCQSCAVHVCCLAAVHCPLTICYSATRWKAFDEAHLYCSWIGYHTALFIYAQRALQTSVLNGCSKLSIQSGAQNERSEWFVPNGRSKQALRHGRSIQSLTNVSSQSALQTGPPNDRSKRAFALLPSFQKEQDACATSPLRRSSTPTVKDFATFWMWCFKYGLVYH